MGDGAEIIRSGRDEGEPGRTSGDRDPVLVYLASLSQGSRRTVASSLDIVAGFLSGGSQSAASLDWPSLGYQHVAAVRSALAESYAPSTANKILSSVKGVMRECRRLGYISSDELSEICDVPSVRGSRTRKGRAISREELRRVLHVCSVDDNRTRGVRDYSITALMYSSGLRRSEVVSLDVQDFDAETSTVTVRSGKGNSDRVVPVNPAAIESIARWLSTSDSASEKGSVPLFRSISKSGRVLDRRMTDQGVLYVLQRRAREAGLEPFTPHDLRRTFIGDLLDAGADISTVQQLAGHANVQTTARYDRRGEAAKRRAASLLDLPGE